MQNHRQLIRLADDHFILFYFFFLRFSFSLNNRLIIVTCQFKYYWFKMKITVLFNSHFISSLIHPIFIGAMCAMRLCEMWMWFEFWTAADKNRQRPISIIFFSFQFYASTESCSLNLGCWSESSMLIFLTN